jgi:hypothetical protein
MYDQPALPAGFFEENCRNIHPQTFAGAVSHLKIKVRDVQVLYGTLLNAGFSGANFCSQGSEAIQELMAGAVKCFRCRVAKDPFRRFVPRANFPPLGQGAGKECSVATDAAVTIGVANPA